MLAGSFVQNNIDIFRYECPNVAKSATTSEAASLYSSQLFGLAGLYSLQFEALQISEKAKGVRVLQSNTVNNSRKRGIKTISWTINEASYLSG